MTDVAALYLLTRSSPYYHLENVDCWPKSRDARLYRGECPVVAHPDCGTWSHYWRHLAKRPEAKHLAVGAVLQVRRVGGVLEHPKLSHLWKTMTLPKALQPMPLFEVPPDQEIDAWGGFSIEVNQCWWGHPSRKSTWLYFVGTTPGRVFGSLPPQTPPPRAARIRWRRNRAGKLLWKRSAGDLGSPESRKRTPLRFAKWLVERAGECRFEGRKTTMGTAW